MLRLPSFALSSAATAILFSSCSYVPPATVSGASELTSARTAYVVREDPNKEVGVYVESALTQRGLKVTSGPAANRHNTDLTVEFVDHWYWDMVMYLRSLDVTVKSTRTGQVLGTGNFHQGFFHTYPDARAKTKEVVDSIFSR